MNSEETLVAQSAADLLEGSIAITNIAQVAVEGAAGELRMPCVVVTARFEDEEQGSTLPKRYTLTAEIRANSSHEAAAIDELFRAIHTALDTEPDVWPVSMETNFSTYIIESQTGSTHEPGDSATRSRSYSVFAKLL
jgi:hypothetical protein